jgi:hypothetical protein
MRMVPRSATGLDVAFQHRGTIARVVDLSMDLHACQFMGRRPRKASGEANLFFHETQGSEYAFSGRLQGLTDQLDWRLVALAALMWSAFATHLCPSCHIVTFNPICFAIDPSGRARVLFFSPPGPRPPALALFIHSSRNPVA